MENVQKPRNININQLTQWLVAATSGQQTFLLKPMDLRILYILVLWEFLSRHHCPGDAIENFPGITSDKQISISEPELMKMVKLLYNPAYYPYFNRVFNM